MWGDNWERLPQEDPRDFVKVRSSWGTPSSPGVCFSFNFFVFICRQYMTCFVSSCSIGSSIVEFCVEGEDLETRQSKRWYKLTRSVSSSFSTFASLLGPLFFLFTYLFIVRSSCRGGHDEAEQE